jgi:hypothetical protein
MLIAVVVIVVLIAIIVEYVVVSLTLVTTKNLRIKLYLGK